jgi:hypothetical protein
MKITKGYVLENDVVEEINTALKNKKIVNGSSYKVNDLFRYFLTLMYQDEKKQLQKLLKEVD